MGSTISYQRAATLPGHDDTILSVHFSVNGKYILATGERLLHICLQHSLISGYTGAHVWEVSTSALVELPPIPFPLQNPKYSFTASCWLLFEKNQQHILLLGSMRGDVLVWGCKNQHSVRAPAMKTDKQVCSLEVRETRVPSGRNGRVVFATADSRVKMWSLSAYGDFAQIFSVSL
ncbi:hypothetical protein EV360DRAFT_58061, partial [Lentinula raphanica]